MIRIRRGEVISITGERPGIQELIVATSEGEAKAINYPDLTGRVAAGSRVVLNTTAVNLGLGTGGNHFVICIEDGAEIDPPAAGHIMKLRYTPMQVKCMSAEEEASPYHAAIKNFTSLAGMPVVVGTLHSMLPLIVAGIRYVLGSKLKIAYVMTDGAALPLAFSKIVYKLKAQGLINLTITAGHAFGGDLESVNVYSGLIAAKAAGADIAVVTMGPGIVGTGTAFGFTGIEQGEIINAVNVLGGKAVAALRASFADPRPRHRGVSHHSLTVLGRVALSPAIVALPQLTPKEAAVIDNQLTAAGIREKHEMQKVDSEPALALLQQWGIRVTTMGRDINQDRAFFLAAGAAGIVAANLLHSRID